MNEDRSKTYWLGCFLDVEVEKEGRDGDENR